MKKVLLIMLISIGLLISLLIPDAYATVLYYHTDHLGSSSVLTDGLGNISRETQYYPYGETFQDTSADQSPYKYTGKEADEETALYYYGARYYDPGIGIFISTDSIRQYASPYAYSGNNPIRFVDIDGNVYIGAIEREALNETVQVAAQLIPGSLSTLADGANLGGINAFGYKQFGDKQLQDLLIIMENHPLLAGEDVITGRWGGKGSDEFFIVAKEGKLKEIMEHGDFKGLFKFENPVDPNKISNVAEAFGKSFPGRSSLRKRLSNLIKGAGGDTNIDPKDWQSALSRAKLRSNFGGIAKSLMNLLKNSGKALKSVPSGEDLLPFTPTGDTKEALDHYKSIEDPSSKEVFRSLNIWWGHYDPEYGEL